MARAKIAYNDYSGVLRNAGISQRIVPESNKRTSLVFINLDAATPVYLRFGDKATGNAPGNIPVQPGETLNMGLPDFVDHSDVWAISSFAAHPFTCLQGAEL